MRVLFYLPVVTEYWFDNIVHHLIRAAAREAEVHVIVPPLWQLTGITGHQLARFADMPDIRWHILDGADHPTYRTAPADRASLVDFVRSIAPDVILCRSADTETPALFPGQVRYIMEADFGPILPDPHRYRERMMLQGPALFDQGLMPPLDAGQRDTLLGAMRPLWDVWQARHGPCPMRRERYLAEAGLPADKRILAVPLEYDGPDNFFGTLHTVMPANDRFIAALTDEIDEDCLLAVTLHPIQQKLRPESADRIAAMDRNKVRIVRMPGDGRQLTRWLIQYADGMILRDSKAISLAAFLGKPFLRLSRYRTADWMGGFSEMRPFLDALREGTAKGADLDDALIWFAFHQANSAFNAGDLDFAELVDRVERPITPDRWALNLERHANAFRDWFPQRLSA